MNNPHISAIVNDGTMSFDHSNDGTVQQLGGCTRDYRNKPYPVKLKIEYRNKALTVRKTCLIASRQCGLSQRPLALHQQQ